MSEAEDARRMPPLEGGRNFRDLGGYPTGDGQLVRWGHIFRSGALTYLTATGRLQLAALGIQTICDLRATSERNRESGSGQATNLRSLHWDYDFESVSLREILRRADARTADGMRASMLDLYRRLPSLFVAPYAALFDQLAQGALPLVFHCAAGKDRTGLAAGLILTGLGVSREVVLEDYALTNTAIDLEATLFQQRNASIGVGDGHVHLATVAPQVRAPLLQAHPEYLQAAFAQIELDYGSVNGYLAGPLGVKDEMLRAIRRHLLEG